MVKTLQERFRAVNLTEDEVWDNVANAVHQPGSKAQLYDVIQIRTMLNQLANELAAMERSRDEHREKYRALAVKFLEATS